VEGKLAENSRVSVAEEDEPGTECKHSKTTKGRPSGVPRKKYRTGSFTRRKNVLPTLQEDSVLQLTQKSRPHTIVVDDTSQRIRESLFAKRSKKKRALDLAFCSETAVKFTLE
jgi:hypothetical protein